MGWFSRRTEPSPPPERRARAGPAPPLPPTPEEPGLVLGPAGEAATLGTLFGVSGPAGEIALPAALHGAAGTTPVPGISGIGILFRDPTSVVLRLGPPPGARWAFRGVHSLAVFTGKLTAVDGEERRELRAGTLASVGRPEATLFVEAGNDSALALAVAGPSFAVTLA